MTTKSYLKELKNNLQVLEYKKRKEILDEIESYIKESNADYSLLVEKFGSAKELANNYLEDMPIKENKNKKIWSKSKKIIFGIFITLALVFIILAIVIYNFTKDPFDYSKFNAQTIDEKIQKPWIEIKDIDSFNVQQSRVIIYWQNNGSKIEASCEGNTNEKRKNIFLVRQSQCFFKIPKQKVNIKAYQSKVILIQPLEEINIKAEQSSIRFAQKGDKYVYELSGKQSDIETFISDDSGIKIKGNFYQSEVSSYEY